MALWIVACADREPRGDDTAAAAPPTDTSAAGRRAVAAALDSGNASYRAGQFEAALRHYRRAAALAPTSAAPHYGIVLAARKLGNATLVDSASAAIVAHVDTTSLPRDSVMRRPRRS